MKTLKVELENCYGIKKLKYDFDFSQNTSVAIYAPNGAMKSSLAQTFKDLADGAQSRDRIFPARASIRKITDENGAELPKDSVVVIQPYDEVFGHTTKTSTLLVDRVLREEYEKLHVEIDASKDVFLKALKAISGSKKNLEMEISSAFTSSEDEFFIALGRVQKELIEQKDSPFAAVKYDRIFDDKALALLGTKDFKLAIQQYTEKYNQLLAASMYFKKGTFNYYNATTIAKNLADNGFFNAKHTVRLNAEKNREITNQTELVKLIEEEKQGITDDPELKKKFDDLEKQINKNADLRSFHEYLQENEHLLPHLANIAKFKELVWKSYFKEKIDLFNDLFEKYQVAEKRKKEIEDAAAQQRTQWESVIQIFNNRFFVPFKLSAKNKAAVILGQEPLLSLGFIFEDGAEQAPVERNALLQSLSTGEKKALYVLNIIFEVEARKKDMQRTVFIVDDIADSFDYKNKYAIIEYLKDISEEPLFRQVILTHNFDFFRTINSRFVKYKNCLMAFKSQTGLTLELATGIKNVFVNDWKPNFYKDPKKKIASIPFIRNILEYTKGDKEPDYLKLTSLLHFKGDSASITQADLDAIFNALFGTTEVSADGDAKIMDLLAASAAVCLKAGQGFNFENKIVLAIATRIAAEQFMIGKINDAAFVASITEHQTFALFRKYKEQFSTEFEATQVLQRVMLMTPESIHLNSFMYEPILDMSDEHLRRLLLATQALK